MSKYKTTIIIGVVLVISTLFVIWLIPFNLKEQLFAFAECANSNTAENAGELILIYNGTAAIGGLAIMIAAYIPALIVLLNSCVS